MIICWSKKNVLKYVFWDSDFVDRYYILRVNPKLVRLTGELFGHTHPTSPNLTAGLGLVPE